MDLPMFLVLMLAVVEILVALLLKRVSEILKKGMNDLRIFNELPKGWLVHSINQDVVDHTWNIVAINPIYGEKAEPVVCSSEGHVSMSTAFSAVRSQIEHDAVTKVSDLD